MSLDYECNKFELCGSLSLVLRGGAVCFNGSFDNVAVSQIGSRIAASNQRSVFL